MKHMKHIKRFNESELWEPYGEDGETSPLGDVKCESFESDEFDEFVAYMEENSSKFGKVIPWSILPQFPVSAEPTPISGDSREERTRFRSETSRRESGMRNKERAKKFWDMYVKSDCKFSVISDCSVTPCKILGVLSCDGVVKSCFDKNDRPCKPGELQEMLSQLGMTEKDL